MADETRRPPDESASHTWIGVLIAELKRRHVIQVVGMYLLTSWGIIQVTTTIFPLIALPTWTATLVFVLLVLGFPLVVFFSWTFDITPEGVRRTGANGRLALKQPFGRRTAIAVVVTAVLLGGWSMWRRERAGAELDANAIAVFPFHVAADASLSYLGEGMVDLLDAKLTGAAALHAVNARAAIQRWARLTSERKDPSTYEAAQVARSLGAGQLLLGRVVGSPARLSISATLYHSVSGRRRADAEVTGPADSLLTLVDALAAQLLSISAGEPRDRLEHLATTSLPALRAYLDGQAAYRRTEFEQAVRLLASALDLDSTFALAGFAHARASFWHGSDDRGIRLAHRHRERLSPRDTVILTAMQNQRELFTPLHVQQRAWENVLERAPDDPDALFFLGDFYYHFGRLLGHTDSDQRAEIAFRRALALDSTSAPILIHLIDFAAERSDTAELRDLADRYRAARRGGAEDLSVDATTWVIGTALRDQEMLNLVRRRFEASTMSNELAFYVAMKSLHLGLPHDDVLPALEAATRNSPSVRGRARVLEMRMAYELVAGRPRTAARLADSIARMGVAEASLRLDQVWDGLLYDVDTATTARAAREYLRLVGDRLSTQSRGLCALASWSLRRRDTDGARGYMAQLRAVPAGAAAARGYDIAGCLAWLNAWHATITKADDAGAALARLDSLLVRGELPVGGGFPYMTVGNIIAMELHEARGEFSDALAAARRRVIGRNTLGMSTQILGQARLAHRLGHRDEAVDAYRYYLALRPAPEPGTAAEANVTAARRALAQLTGERRN